MIIGRHIKDTGIGINADILSNNKPCATTEPATSNIAIIPNILSLSLSQVRKYQTDNE